MTTPSNTRLLIDLDDTIPTDPEEVVSFRVGGEEFTMTKPVPYEVTVGAVAVLQGFTLDRINREGAAAIVQMMEAVTLCIIEMIDDPEGNGDRLRDALRRRKASLEDRCRLAQMLVEAATDRPFDVASPSGSWPAPAGHSSTDVPDFARVEGSEVDPAMMPGA